MTTQNKEVRVQLFDLDGKQYATCSSFAMGFLLDHCSVIEVIEDLIDAGCDDMFIETSYGLDDETFKGYYIRPDGVIKLASEFGRDVQPKHEMD